MLLKIGYPDPAARTLLLGLIQQLWDRSEPNGWYHHTLPGTLPDSPPHKVLVHMARSDAEVANLGTQIMVRTKGMPQLFPVNATFYGIPNAVAPFDGSALVELLYVVWEDSELRSDGLHAIALSVSSDGGASWTPPRAVRDSDRVHQFTPAVTAYDGAVLVSFRSMVPDEDRVFTRYVASTDAGITFGRERKLGKAGNLQFAYTSMSVITNGMDIRFLGDYMGLAMSGRRRPCRLVSAITTTERFTLAASPDDLERDDHALATGVRSGREGANV